MDETEVQTQILNREDYNDQIEQMEDQSDQSDSIEWAEVPSRRKQDSLYTLFQKVWKAPDSSKVANLSLPELGKPMMTVRDAQYLALLAMTFKHPRFAMFFKHTSEIALATSASKKGWFTELFVSQKKFTTRSTALMGGGPSDKKKWSIFGGNQAPQQEY
jgi:hypothetical protein